MDIDISMAGFMEEMQHNRYKKNKYDALLCPVCGDELVYKNNCMLCFKCGYKDC